MAFWIFIPSLIFTGKKDLKCCSSYTEVFSLSAHVLPILHLWAMAVVPISVIGTRITKSWYLHLTISIIQVSAHSDKMSLCSNTVEGSAWLKLVIFGYLATLLGYIFGNHPCQCRELFYLCSSCTRYTYIVSNIITFRLMEALECLKQGMKQKGLVNPRHMLRRVTVVVLCLSVCQSLPTLAATYIVYRLSEVS